MEIYTKKPGEKNLSENDPLYDKFYMLTNVSVVEKRKNE